MRPCCIICALFLSENSHFSGGGRLGDAAALVLHHFRTRGQLKKFK
jgi:hypothetical protein